MLKLSRNNQKYQNVRGPPEHSAIGNIYIVIFCYNWVLLHYTMSFKTIAVGINDAFWYGPHSEDQEFFKQIYQNYLVALIHVGMYQT